MSADVNVGLVLEDDAFSFINPRIEFVHDEVVVKVSVIFALLCMSCYYGHMQCEKQIRFSNKYFIEIINYFAK